MIAQRNNPAPMPEHEFEAERGLPEVLPTDERIVWQGSPSWRSMAREAMHTRMLTIYFAVLIAWRGVNVLADGGDAAAAGIAMAWLLALAVIAIAALTLMGWLVARTSVYTITDKRVVMRIGVVLSITFNLPFTKITAAALRAKADGSGDITLSLAETDHIAYVHLWPHARPWKLAHTQPMLRGLSNATEVARLLAEALADVEVAVRPAVAALPNVPPRDIEPPASTTERPLQPRPKAAPASSPQPAASQPQPLAA